MKVRLTSFLQLTVLVVVLMVVFQQATAARKQGPNSNKGGVRGHRNGTGANRNAKQNAQRERNANKALLAEQRAAEKASRRAARLRQKASRFQVRNLRRVNSSSLELNDAQCLAAINQCSLFDILESEMKPVWERTTFVNEKRKLYRQRKRNLKRLRDEILQLIDNLIRNPLKDPARFLRCGGRPGDRGGEGRSIPGDDRIQTSTPAGLTGAPIQDSTAVDPWVNPNNPDPWVNPNNPDPWVNPYPVSTCSLSQWSSWSAPFGFGIEERTRKVVPPGEGCTGQEQLRQDRNIPEPTNEDGDYVTDNYQVVSDNFYNDFIRASEGGPRDILLVLDSSGSISDTDFETMKRGLKVLIDTFCGSFGPAPSENRLAIVQFSTSVRTVYTFSEDQDVASLKAAVDNLQPMYGFTCTGDALLEAFEEWANDGVRDFLPNDTLIITDGRSNCGPDLLTSSLQLQERSNVYALAIGLAGDDKATTEITSLVSDENPHHLFSLANFKDFESMVDAVRKQKEDHQCQSIIIN